ncbi:hypothetical protein BN1110_05041 [bacterium YEK0313]|nr:hypothetical protein BN1110_05041 [bacterium YEK0313]
MAIRGPIAKRPELREALIAAAIEPWRVDLERSAEVAHNARASGDVVLFRRDAGQDHPAAGLTLWGTEDGYYVPNIVPLEIGRLTFAQYNAVLADFIARVAAPVTAQFGFTILTTEPRQTLDDWLSPDAALKLKRFSGVANKSTGASHPSDQRRWFDFLVAVYRSGDKPGADRLARWLHEVDGWDEDSAHNLAGDFETAIALLAYYEEH